MVVVFAGTLAGCADTPSNPDDLDAGDAPQPCTPEVELLTTPSEQTTRVREFMVSVRVSNSSEVQVGIEAGDLWFSGYATQGDEYEIPATLEAGANTLRVIAITNGEVRTVIGILTITYERTEPLPQPGGGLIVGRVFDGGSMSPLQAARVYVRGLEGELRTGADGTFAFPAPVGAFLITAEKSEYTFAQRKGYMTAGAASNVRDFELLALDSVRVKVTAGQGGELLNSTGEVKVSVPVGAVSRDITISAIFIPRAQTLAGDLPDSTRWTHAVELPPDGAQFDKPVALSIKNTLGFAAGQQIPIGYYDRSLGAWVPEGMATVTDGGGRVTTTVTHFSAHDINLPANERQGPNAEDQDRDDCRKGRRGSSIVDHLRGQLSLFVPFAIGMNGQPLRMAYESSRATARAHVIRPVDFSAAPMADKLRASFSFAGRQHRMELPNGSPPGIYFAGTPMRTHSCCSTSAIGSSFAMILPRRTSPCGSACLNLAMTPETSRLRSRCGATAKVRSTSPPPTKRSGHHTLAMQASSRQQWRPHFQSGHSRDRPRVGLRRKVQWTRGRNPHQDRDYNPHPNL